MTYIKKLLYILIIIAILGVSYLGFMTLTDYKPAEIIELEVHNRQDDFKSDTLRITTFNIGYATLDESADFFMEGGKQSRAKSKEQVTSNMTAITNFLLSQKSDIILLQELDLKAMRSKWVNEYQMMKDQLTDYSSSFALNYKVPWVPVPLLKPYGYVESGISIFSKLDQEARRYQFPGNEPWPRQLALLDRCFIESTMTYKGQDITVLNVHMSAYDAGGTIREQQVAYLKNYLEDLRLQGQFVIVGGDFNHELPGTDADNFNSTSKPDWLKTMTTDFEGYTWYVDPSQPTSRSMEQPYVKGQNYECIIDGFMVSDNLEVLGVTHHNLNYKNSDHNPVTIEISLKGF